MSDSRRRVVLPVLLCLLCFSAAPAATLEIGVAPLFVTGIDAGSEKLPGGECGERLRRLIGAAMLSGEVSLRALEGDGESAPRSFLEAALLAERSGSDCLLYGYISRGEFTWEGELKLFDRESGRVAASFFDRDAVDEYDRFIASLARKVADFLILDAGYAAPAPAPSPERNIFSLPLRLGYPAAGGAGYGRVTRGIVACETGLLLTPARGAGSREFRTGCLVSYRLALNAAGYEAYRLHSIGVALPAAFVFPVAGTDRISLGAGAGVRFDLLDQERNYYGEYRALGVAPILDLALVYEHSLRGAWSIGFGAELETALYSGPEVSVLSGIQLRYEFLRPAAAIPGER